MDKDPVQKLKKHLVVGLGSIGRRHTSLLLKKGYEVAGADPDVQNVDGIKMYPSMEEGMVFNPDMVWLCSPTQYHAQQACKIIEKKIHLFIEKPVAHTLKHAMIILEAHNTYNRQTCVWCAGNMRYHPAVVALKQFLDSGMVGKPLICKIHFSHWLPNMRPDTDYRDTYAAGKEGGGIILDDVHDIDLALWLSGPAVEVNGFSHQSGLLELACEDVAQIVITHETGCLSSIHMDFLRKDKSRGIELIGEKGTLEWRSRFKPPENAVIHYFPENTHQGEIVWQKRINSFDMMFERQLADVEKRVGKKQLYQKSLLEAVEVLKVVSALKNE